jgi:hypothetical protein
VAKPLKEPVPIASECRSANIVRDHAMILPDDATPKPDGIFGRDSITLPGLAKEILEIADAPCKDAVEVTHARNRLDTRRWWTNWLVCKR